MLVPEVWAGAWGWYGDVGLDPQHLTVTRAPLGATPNPKVYMHMYLMDRYVQDICMVKV